MLKNTLRRIVYGFVLGMAVGNFIAALTGHPNVVSPALLQRAGSLSAALLLQTVGSGLIGAAGMGGVSLYEIDRWPLLLTTAVHFCIYMAVFLPVSYLLGWFGNPVELLVTAAIMLGIHLTIFLIMCARYRAEVRELNRMQERFLHSVKGDAA